MSFNDGAEAGCTRAQPGVSDVTYTSPDSRFFSLFLARPSLDHFPRSFGGSREAEVSEAEGRPHIPPSFPPLPPPRLYGGVRGRRIVHYE